MTDDSSHASSKERSTDRGRGAPNTSWLLGILAIAAIVFGRVLTWPFLNWDDWELVLENRDLLPANWPSVLGYWLRPHLGLYAPLTYLTYMALSAISHATTGEFHPAVFHAANLLLHLTSGALIWSLLRCLQATPAAAAVGAGLFLLHPLQVEPVAWVSSLNTVLAGALGLAALICHARSGNRLPWFVAATLLYLMALTAKASVCGLPLAAFAIDRLLLHRPLRASLIRCGAWLLLTVPILIIGTQAQPATMAASLAPAHRLTVAMDALGMQLTHVLLPFGLAIDYGRTPTGVTFREGETWVHVSLALALVVLIVTQWKRRRYLSAAGICFIAGVAPTLGLVPFDFQAYSTVADR